jgi:hypothetical protein
MNTRSTLVGVVAAVAFALGQAAAQDTTQGSRRRTQRVQVSKGDVALPRIDTVVVVRTDTVFVRRPDTVYFPGRRVVQVPYEVVRTDTFRVAVSPEPFVRTPFYAALYTGMTMPAGRIDDMYVNGLHAGGMLGWDASEELMGIRLKGDVTMLSRESGAPAAIVGTTTPVIVNVGADLKVSPFVAGGWRIYGVAGGLVSSYQGLATVAERGRGATVGPGNRSYHPSAGSDWVTRWGWNAGGGADIPLGQQELFFEARVVTLYSDHSQSWFIPISLGIRFF